MSLLAAQRLLGGGHHGVGGSARHASYAASETASQPSESQLSIDSTAAGGAGALSVRKSLFGVHQREGDHRAVVLRVAEHTQQLTEQGSLIKRLETMVAQSVEAQAKLSRELDEWKGARDDADTRGGSAPAAAGGASVAGRDDARDDQHGVRQYPPVAARVQRRSHPLRARVPARRVRPVLALRRRPSGMRLITVIRSSSHTRTNTTMRQQLPPCSSMSFSFSIKDCRHRCRRAAAAPPSTSTSYTSLRRNNITTQTASISLPRRATRHRRDRGLSRASGAWSSTTVSCNRILSM